MFSAAGLVGFAVHMGPCRHLGEPWKQVDVCTCRRLRSLMPPSCNLGGQSAFLRLFWHDFGTLGAPRGRPGASWERREGLMGNRQRIFNDYAPFRDPVLGAVRV